MYRFLLRRCTSTSAVIKDTDSRLRFVSRELEILSSFKPSSGHPEGLAEKALAGVREEGGNLGYSHRWPEWENLLETLQKNGYLDPPDIEKGYVALSKYANRVRTACLDYARDRSELIRSFLPINASVSLATLGFWRYSSIRVLH